MSIWMGIWIVVFIVGVICFSYISFIVIIRGFAEVRSLLKEMIDV